MVERRGLPPVIVRAGTNIQEALDTNPPGTRFLLEPAVYGFNKPLKMKPGQSVRDKPH